ncbi:TetR/AcrR family transcriptional regulator [Actinoallomurus sp. NBC_01490]|uniref:TetR/AcrR family transcriptional regulator n=1 Tax=Actinoallomurus sp. NBC_01490 TaxID=2903557 RepID=UPI002E318A10|nr:helix-turn-helix domain-containing protein [Actinoallomurus sp. NBC_01490]
MAERKSRQARSDNSKELILKAALRLAVERGFAGTTMADVSAASGLPIGSVYWHFKSKEQLFVALLEHSYEEWQKIYTDEVGLRDKVTRGILGLAGSADPSRYTDEEAFLKVAQILALDKRLGGLGAESPVTQAYVAVRAKMFQVNVRRVAASLPPEVTEAHPELPQQLTVLGLAMTDGLYVHANSEVHLDFAAYADVAARALEALVEQYAAPSGTRREGTGRERVSATPAAD